MDALVTVVASAVAGALVGVAGHAFASRWPAPRRTGIGPSALAAVAAGAMVALALAGPRGAAAAPAAVLVALLVPIVAVDLDLRLIPDLLTVPGIAVCLALGTVTGTGVVTVAAWALAAAAILGLPAATAPGSVGWGDVKLVGLMGAALADSVLMALGVGLVVGGVMAAALVVRHGRDARGRTLPFAPPLAAGSLLALLQG